jgi:hypothetical protein
MHDYDEDNDGRFPDESQSKCATRARSRKSRVTDQRGRGCLARF